MAMYMSLAWAIKYRKQIAKFCSYIYISKI